MGRSRPRAATMAHLSNASVWSTDLESPMSEVSSDRVPRGVLLRLYPSQWTPERLGLTPRRNDALNNYARVHRHTRPWPYEHSLTLGFARYLVAVLIQRPWPDHVAKRIVAFFVLGQQ